MPDEVARAATPRTRSTGLTIAWVLALIVLLVTGALGLSNGVRQLPYTATFGQMTVAVGVLLYGILGIAAAVGLLRRRAWSLPLTIAWAVIVTYVPGAAVHYYGGEEAGSVAALSASIGAGVTALLVVLAVRAVTRRLGKSE